MLKYLFLIILGILLYILLNHQDRFSIGALPTEFYLVMYSSRDTDKVEIDFIQYNGFGNLRENNRDFLTRLFPNPPRTDREGNRYYPFAIYGRDALHIPSLMANPLIIRAHDGNTINTINPALFFDLAVPTDATIRAQGSRTARDRSLRIHNLLTWLNSEGTGPVLRRLHPNGFTRQELRDILDRYRRLDHTQMYNAIIQVLNLFDQYGYRDDQFAGFGGGGGGAAAPAPAPGGEAAPAPGGEAAPAPGGGATGLPGAEPTAEPEPATLGVSRSASPSRKCAARSRKR